MQSCIDLPLRRIRVVPVAVLALPLGQDLFFKIKNSTYQVFKLKTARREFQISSDQKAFLQQIFLTSAEFRLILRTIRCQILFKIYPCFGQGIFNV